MHMQTINKKGSKVFKAINIMLIVTYCILIVSSLWNVIDGKLVKIVLILLFVFIFNTVLSFKTYNLKFMLPGLFGIIMVSLAIIKVINIKIELNIFILIILVSAISSITFVTIFRKCYSDYD